MTNTRFRLCLLSAVLVSAPASAQSAAAAGTGLYVAPSSAAYGLLANAAGKILADARASVPDLEVVVIYDQATFGSVPYYPSAVEQIKSVLSSLCGNTGANHANAFALGDAGAAASGLAALIGVTLPSYAINGQALTTIDTTALVGVFASVAKGDPHPIAVINPAYLLPAVSAGNVTCRNYPESQSVASLWALAAVEAHRLEGTPAANAEPGKSALARYQKVSDVYLAADKGVPLLSKLLVVESLLYSIADPAHTAVVDMKLDGAGIESTTMTVLWFRSTRVSSNVLAHYSILKVRKAGSGLALTLDKPGYANYMMKNVKLKRVGSSVMPAGTIN